VQYRFVDFPFDLTDIKGLRRSILSSHRIRSYGNLPVSKSWLLLPPAHPSPSQCHRLRTLLHPAILNFRRRYEATLWRST
jgi:hypothetical protein